MIDFSFEIIARDKGTRARAGIIKTGHGEIKTPYLVPVATKGNIKSIYKKDIVMLGAQCLLVNTFHLHDIYDAEKIKKMGGIHSIMGFNKPLFSDSGGFQVFSLGFGREQSARKIGFFPGERAKEKSGESQVKITKKGVFFKSEDNKKEYFISPKESMHIQSCLGTDIIMAFDECTSAVSTKEYIKESMERSHRWEKESLKYRDKKQALYGIVHGGWFKDLRIKSTKFINSLHFDGIAIGGSLGKTKSDMYKIIDWIIPELDERPRHMLGIGWVDDIFECVERGLDTFDCVEMTRIARHGSLYVGPESGGLVKNKFRIDIAKSVYENDKDPIDMGCLCYTCKNYTRADVRRFYKRMQFEKDNEKIKFLYGRLATIHNIHFMLNLVKKIRDSIINGSFRELKKHWMN